MKTRLLFASSLIFGLLTVAALPADAQGWKGTNRLQGRVLNEATEPIQGATVTLFYLGGGATETEREGPAVLTTDKRGRWAVLGLTYGPWKVVIEKEDFLVSDGTIRISDGAARKPLLITLRPIPPEQKAAELGSVLTDGNSLLQEGDSAGARAKYEEVLAGLPEEELEARVEVMRGVARTYYQEENLEKAQEALVGILEVKPQDAATLQLLITLLSTQGKDAEADTYIAMLPEGAKLDSSIALNRGIEQYNANEMEPALAAFNRVIAEHPELPDGYYYRGLVFLNMDKQPEARADFEKLLEIAPDHPEAANAKEFLGFLPPE